MIIMIKLLIGLIMFIATICVFKIKKASRKFEIIMAYSLIFTFIANTIAIFMIEGFHGVLIHGLPLFHCSLGMMIYIYYFLKDKKPDIFLKNANVVALSGSIIAIFFSNLIYIKPYEYTISTIAHIIFFCTSIYNTWIKNIRLFKHEYKYSICALIIWNIIIFIINDLLNTNYSFVSISPFEFYINPILVLILNTILFFVIYFIDYKYLSIKTKRD